MTAKLTLSIVTPSYNQGEYIGQTLQSVLDQVDPSFKLEYLIMDGGSTDTTHEVITSFLPKFKRAGIKCLYVSQRDKGQSDAINKGWKKASGQILTYLNSDDYYQKGVLKKVVQFFESHPTMAWGYGGWRVVNKRGKVYHTYQHTEFNSFAFRSYASNIGQPSCFFRRSLLKKAGPLNPDLHLAMDYDLWLRFLKLAQPAVMPFVIANLRYYSDAKSAKYMTKHNYQAWRVAWRHAGSNFLIRGYATVRFFLGWLAIILGRNLSQQVPST